MSVASSLAWRRPPRAALEHLVRQLLRLPPLQALLLRARERLGRSQRGRVGRRCGRRGRGRQRQHGGRVLRRRRRRRPWPARYPLDGASGAWSSRVQEGRSGGLPSAALAWLALPASLVWLALPACRPLGSLRLACPAFFCISHPAGGRLSTLCIRRFGTCAPRRADWQTRGRRSRWLTSKSSTRSLSGASGPCRAGRRKQIKVSAGCFQTVMPCPCHLNRSITKTLRNSGRERVRQGASRRGLATLQFPCQTQLRFGSIRCNRPPAPVHCREGAAARRRSRRVRRRCRPPCPCAPPPAACCAAPGGP